MDFFTVPTLTFGLHKTCAAARRRALSILRITLFVEIREQDCVSILSAVEQSEQLAVR
jgi:hypothetical protein